MYHNSLAWRAEKESIAIESSGWNQVPRQGQPIAAAGSGFFRLFLGKIALKKP